jgi:hypothetical protein
MLSEKTRDKENNSYDKSPEHYRNNLKINAEIIPRAKYQPRVAPLTNPTTKNHKQTHKNKYQLSPHITSRNKKRQHKNIYRTPHGYNPITRTSSQLLPHPHTLSHTQ